jgi:hypothetical protein
MFTSGGLGNKADEAQQKAMGSFCLYRKDMIEAINGGSGRPSRRRLDEAQDEVRQAESTSPRL